MDKVRLGRALGYGTRHAARTLAAVAEAATAPDPRAARPGPQTVASNQTRAQAQPQSGTVPPAASPRSRVKAPSAAQLRGAGRSMWGPLATYSGALWLRVTGLFFAVIALAMASGAWRQRGALRTSSAPAIDLHHLWVFVGFAALFGYFSISSFLRANLRERRAARKSA